MRLNPHQLSTQHNSFHTHCKNGPDMKRSMALSSTTVLLSSMMLWSSLAPDWSHDLQKKKKKVWQSNQGVHSTCPAMQNGTKGWRTWISTGCFMWKMSILNKPYPGPRSKHSYVNINSIWRCLIFTRSWHFSCLKLLNKFASTKFNEMMIDVFWSTITSLQLRNHVWSLEIYSSSLFRFRYE